MIIQTEGTYAFLNDYPPLNTFKEWRYLVAGSLCDSALVLPQTTSIKQGYDLKKQKLVEVITVRASDVLQSWETQNLSIQQEEDRKQPDFIGFQRDMFSTTNTALFAIYSKIIGTSTVNQAVAAWYGEVKSALSYSLYTKDGFSMAIKQLSIALALSVDEIATVNTYLYKYDLELIK